MRVAHHHQVKLYSNFSKASEVYAPLTRLLEASASEGAARSLYGKRNAIQGKVTSSKRARCGFRPVSISTAAMAADASVGKRCCIVFREGHTPTLREAPVWRVVPANAPILQIAACMLMEHSPPPFVPVVTSPPVTSVALISEV